MTFYFYHCLPCQYYILLSFGSWKPLGHFAASRTEKPERGREKKGPLLNRRLTPGFLKALPHRQPERSERHEARGTWVVSLGLCKSRGPGRCQEVGERGAREVGPRPAKTREVRGERPRASSLPSPWEATVAQFLIPVHREDSKAVKATF